MHDYANVEGQIDRPRARLLSLPTSREPAAAFLRANANVLQFPADAQKADAAASLLIEGVKSLTAKKQFSARPGRSEACDAFRRPTVTTYAVAAQFEPLRFELELSGYE